MSDVGGERECSMGSTFPVSRSPSTGPRSSAEVVAYPTRRRFSAVSKLRIVQEADAAVEFHQVGALLRREGLHSSHLVAWRRLRAAGALSALGQPRGRKPSAPLGAVLARLKLENARLAQRLSVAEEISAVQKKVSALVGIALGSPEAERERELRPC
jgi:transposase